MLATMFRSPLVLILAIAACGHAKQSVKLYEAGDYAGASRAADDGLANHPDDGGLWAMKVRAALALGDGDAVAKAYASLVEHRGADDKELLRDLATATLGQGLESPSVKLKIAAIDAIEDLELQSLADQVFLQMNSEDDRVAAAAAIAVIHGYQQAPQVADDMLKSENAEARRIAVDGVGKKIGKLAASALENAANDQRCARAPRRDLLARRDEGSGRRRDLHASPQGSRRDRARRVRERPREDRHRQPRRSSANARSPTRRSRAARRHRVARRGATR